MPNDAGERQNLDAYGAAPAIWPPKILVPQMQSVPALARAASAFVLLKVFPSPNTSELLFASLSIVFQMLLGSGVENAQRVPVFSSRGVTQ